jgi:hypothetical protein
MDTTVTASPQGSQGPPPSASAVTAHSGDSDRDLIHRTIVAITVHGEIFGEQDLLDFAASIERFGFAQFRTWVQNWREIKADADLAERQRQAAERDARR